MTAAHPELLELYREKVLDHSRHPRNCRPMEQPTARAEGHNPLCGDRVTVYLRLDGERVGDASFEASGCAISLASASMMTERVRGRPVPEVRAAIDETRGMFAPGATSTPEGDVAALSGVRGYPTRVRCALLPWQALAAALDGTTGTVDTEQGS